MKFMKNHSINQDILYLNHSHSDISDHQQSEMMKMIELKVSSHVDCLCLILLPFVIIWNCCGFCNQLYGMKSINAKYKPISVVLTITSENPPVANGYLQNQEVQWCRQRHTDGKISGGVCLLYSYDYRSSVMHMHKGLKVVAVRVVVRRLITVCSLYFSAVLLQITGLWMNPASSALFSFLVTLMHTLLYKVILMLVTMTFKLSNSYLIVSSVY